MTAVGAMVVGITAVGVTSARNDFFMIINIGSTIILWYSLFFRVVFGLASVTQEYWCEWLVGMTKY